MPAALDLSVAQVLDDICETLLEAAYRGTPYRRLHLDSGTYRRLELAKARELARGSPLVVLGLEVVADPLLEPGRPALS
jgi:hypothetical protein